MNKDRIEAFYKQHGTFCPECGITLEHKFGFSHPYDRNTGKPSTIPDLALVTCPKRNWLGKSHYDKGYYYSETDNCWRRFPII